MSIIIPANSAVSGGFEVANSVLFNSPDSASMQKTAGAPTDNNKWTYSVWVKRSKLGTLQEILYGDDGGTSNFCTIRFNDTSDTLTFKNRPGSTTSTLTTSAVFRDPNAWMHLVFVLDTSNSTAADRDIIYINGVRETSFSTESHSGSGDACFINSNGNPIKISKGNSSSFFDGYMAEACFIDGLALSPTDFGEFDEDSPTIWKPKNVSGLTFGNNGFYLDFKDSSNLGNDANGGTDLTETNLAATDQSTDTCTNNFATLNPLDRHKQNTAALGASLFNGITTFNTAASNALKLYVKSSIGVTSGKYYWEMKRTTNSAFLIGICYQNYFYDATTVAHWDQNAYLACSFQEKGNGNYEWAGKSGDGGIADTGIAAGDGQILGFALDMDNYAIYAHLNGTYFAVGGVTGVPTSGASKTGSLLSSFTSGGLPYVNSGQPVFPFCADINGSSNCRVDANFGYPPFAISSGNADGNGYGNFEYAVPSGYFALNTKNLAEYG